ncbi:MAG: hypothetical protein JWM28_2131 [Chitinophagaceae bacterium]|nr:hypothetical protein [Chitinophagaceae bacterium]
MSKAIKTYDDLLAYQLQLEELLIAQKQVLHYDIIELKEELGRVANPIRIAAKFFTRNKDHTAIVQGAGLLIDLALKKVALPRAGRISRRMIPFLVKNISSHLVAEHKQDLLNKVVSLISHKKKSK